MEKLSMFGELDAYSHVKEAEAALDDYYKTTTLNQRSLPTPAPAPKN
jgi:hypothetical protein